MRSWSRVSPAWRLGQIKETKTLDGATLICPLRFHTRHRHWGFEQRTCPTSFANCRKSKGKPFGTFLIYDDCPLLFPCDALQQDKTLSNRPYLNAIPH